MYRRPELEVKWQNLSRTDYQVTSPKSQEYNCFAWAAEENDRWWQPIPGEQFYWPEGVPQEETIEAYIQAYQTLGYEICNGDRLEFGYQKIAIYVDLKGIPTHAARQLANGKWTSKLGWLEDIEHELDGLIGDRYGVVGQILITCGKLEKGDRALGLGMREARRRSQPQASRQNSKISLTLEK